MESIGGLRRPLGLMLPGGGALGSWQAACLAELVSRGLRFDRILGFSAGALCGAGYFLGRMDELVERWREVDRGRILRLSPRWKPFTLFSGASMWEAVEHARDEERAKRLAACELTVMAYCKDDGRTEYSRFTPGGQRGWDGPLAERLVASCSIPAIFPPLEVHGRTYLDGVVPGAEPMRFDALAGCADVLCIEPVRPDEAGRRWWSPWRRYDQVGRDVCLKHMADGIASLGTASPAPRVFRVHPSETLSFSMLSFRSRWCGPAMELGRRDAEAFLRAPRALDAEPSMSR